MATGLELLKNQRVPHGCSCHSALREHFYNPGHVEHHRKYLGKMMIPMANHTKKQTTSPHLQIGEFYTRILYRTCLKLYKSTYMYRKKKSQHVSNGWPKVVELWLNFKKSAS